MAKDIDLQKLHMATARLHDDVATTRNAKGEFNSSTFNLGNFIKNLITILNEVTQILPLFIPPQQSDVLKQSEEIKK